MRILLVEDDVQLTDHLTRLFAAEGYPIESADNGLDGLRAATSGTHDVIILDRMLPGLDGLSIVRAMREAHLHTPVLCLTTKSGVRDRVEGLDAGGDDYLVKPFAFVELLARVRALSRRAAAASDSQLQAGELKMDLIKRTVACGNRAIELLPQEFKLLEYLMRNQGRTVTRAMLLENVWDVHFDPMTSVVESHVSRLRSKISPDSPKEFIQTVRNVGYVLRPPHQNS